MASRFKCIYHVFAYIFLFLIVVCNISGCEVCSEQNVCSRCSGDLELNANGNECTIPVGALSPSTTGLSAGVVVGMFYYTSTFYLLVHEGVAVSRAILAAYY